jgi:hypothetical protein
MIAATLFVIIGTSADGAGWVPGRGASGVFVVWEEPRRNDDGLKGSHKQRRIMAPTV